MNCSCTKCCAIETIIERDGVIDSAVAGPAYRSAQRNVAQYFIERTKASYRQSSDRLDIDFDSAIGIERVPLVSLEKQVL